jgi:hypothetical protein
MAARDFQDESSRAVGRRTGPFRGSELDGLSRIPRGRKMGRSEVQPERTGSQGRAGDYTE